jgi:uncharacterized protein YndB with AHSA1/START domain
MEIQSEPKVVTAMLIRRPIEEVFEAFVDPEITSKFWFTKGSARLAAGEKVRWDWEMYGKSGDVSVDACEPGRRICVQMGPTGQPSTTAEWTFDRRGEDQTFVTITNSGFEGAGDDVVGQALGSTQGFTLVLAGAKAYLEHGLQLNLVEDRYPDTLVEGWQGRR